MEPMTTLSEVINNLKNEGYTEDFNLRSDCIDCKGREVQLHPDEFIIDRHYRFEGTSDPGDEAVVYAISARDGSLKGILVNGYDAYGDELTNEMVKKLEERRDTY